jgi:hypothetical protein
MYSLFFGAMNISDFNVVQILNAQKPGTWAGIQLHALDYKNKSRSYESMKVGIQTRICSPRIDNL